MRKSLFVPKLEVGIVSAVIVEPVYQAKALLLGLTDVYFK